MTDFPPAGFLSADDGALALMWLQRHYAIVFDGSKTQVVSLPIDGAPVRATSPQQFRAYFDPWRVATPTGTSSIAERFLMDAATTRHLGHVTGVLPDSERERHLTPDQKWLLECLRKNQIGGVPFGSASPKREVFDDFRHSLRAQGVDGLLTPHRMGHLLSSAFPALRQTARRIYAADKRAGLYEFPRLEDAKGQFERRFGVKP